jgi:hypothetical protein
MSPETVEAEFVFSLRIPVSLNEKLISEAKAENRSRQSHIVYLLNQHFNQQKSEKEKKK